MTFPPIDEAGTAAEKLSADQRPTTSTSSRRRRRLAVAGVTVFAATVVGVSPAATGNAAPAAAAAVRPAATMVLAHGSSGPMYKRRVSLDLRRCGSVGTGDAGSCVVSLQTWLNIEGGYDLDVDGVFGSATRRAVTDFQARHDLPTAGMFGPRSRAALGAWWRDTMSEAEAVGDAESVEGVDFDDAGTDLHRGMGDDELWSVACAGAGMIVGWVTKSAALGGLAGLVCDIYIRPGSGG